MNRKSQYILQSLEIIIKERILSQCKIKLFKSIKKRGEGFSPVFIVQKKKRIKKKNKIKLI